MVPVVLGCSCLEHWDSMTEAWLGCSLDYTDQCISVSSSLSLKPPVELED